MRYTYAKHGEYAKYEQWVADQGALFNTSSTPSPAHPHPVLVITQNHINHQFKSTLRPVYHNHHHQRHQHNRQRHHRHEHHGASTRRKLAPNNPRLRDKVPPRAQQQRQDTDPQKRRAEWLAQAAQRRIAVRRARTRAGFVEAGGIRQAGVEAEELRDGDADGCKSEGSAQPGEKSPFWGKFKQALD